VVGEPDILPGSQVFFCFVNFQRYRDVCISPFVSNNKHLNIHLVQVRQEVPCVSYVLPGSTDFASTTYFQTK